MGFSDSRADEVFVLLFLGDCISDARGASRVLEQLDLRSVLGLKTRGELPILHDQKGTVRSNSGSGALVAPLL